MAPVPFGAHAWSRAAAPPAQSRAHLGPALLSQPMVSPGLAHLPVNYAFALQEEEANGYFCCVESAMKDLEGRLIIKGDESKRKPFTSNCTTKNTQDMHGQRITTAATVRYQTGITWGTQHNHVGPGCGQVTGGWQGAVIPHYTDPH